jgi:serine/threonine protein kinase
MRGLGFSRPAGHGAFKATFRAEESTGQALAVKVYLPGAVSERAAREIHALAQLSQVGHPSLPSFLDLVVFTHAGTKFVVSIEEFLSGGNLSEMLAASGPLDRSRIISLATQMASSLSVVADAELVHRDVKPDNIMFREDGTAVLVDFGLVRNLAMDSLTQTWLAQGPGTPFFAAPEQLNNDKSLIDRRTDQFALGVTLAQASYGQHPYAHPGDTPDAAIARVAQRHRPHQDFTQWTEDEGLRPIAKMIEPWPVARYRLPSQLIAAWSGV